MILRFFSLVLCGLFFNLQIGRTQTANSILNKRVENELDRRNIFIKDSKLSNKQIEANRKILALALSNFQLNELLLSRNVISPTPLSCSLSDLGRQIYQNDLPKTVSDFLNHNQLLGLGNGKLLSIVDPDPGQSYFKIYYSLNDLLNGSAKIEADARVLNYINAKVAAATDYQNSHRSQFTAVVGTFKSYFNEAFSRFKQGTIADNDVDLFMGLYNLYSSGTLGINDRNYVIGAANALAISIDDNNQWGNRIDFAAGMEASASLPWVRASAMGSYKWSNKTEREIDNRAFEVYFLNPPTPTAVPSWDQLRKAWNTTTLTGSDKYTIEPGSNIIFSATEPKTITVNFGPFSDPNLLNGIEINQQEFVKSQKEKLISKVPIIIDRKLITDRNLVQLTISFEPNADWINGQNISSVSNSAQLIIQFGTEKFLLQRSYPVSFVASVMARPTSLGTVNNPTITNNDKNYSWSFPIMFDNLPDYISPGNLYDGPIVYSDKKIGDLMYASGLEPNVSIVNDPNAPGTLKATVNMIVPVGKLTSANDHFRVTLPISIKYNNRPANNYPLLLRRQVEVTLAGIIPKPDQDSAYKSFTSVNDLLNSLKEDLIVDGKSLTEFKKQFTEADESTKKTMSQRLIEILAIPSLNNSYKVPHNLIKSN